MACKSLFLKNSGMELRLLFIDCKRQKQATSDKNKRQAEKISGKDKTAENKEVIVAYITAQGNAKTSEIAEHIGLSQPRVRAILSELVSEGIVEAEGESRARYYKIR